MNRRTTSRLYLKGMIGEFGLVKDSLSYEQAQRLKKLIKKLFKGKYKVKIKYSRKYEDYSVWSNFSEKDAIKFSGWK